MQETLYLFNNEGYYTGSSELPINPVTGLPFEINTSVATKVPVPTYDQALETAKFVDGVWVLEPIANGGSEPTPEPEPEPVTELTCSKRQGELALLSLESPDTLFPSLLHWVETAIEAVEDPIEKRMMLAYFNAYEWHSNDEFVIKMWTKAGRDLEDLPGVFLFAQTL